MPYRPIRKQRSDLFVASTLDSVAADPGSAELDPSSLTPEEQTTDVRQEFRRLLTGSEREAALQSLTEILREITQATGAAIALAGPGGDVICVSSSGAAPPTGVVIDGRSGISGACLQSGRTTVCDDAAYDPRVHPDARHFAMSIAAAPVRANNQTRGLVEILSPNPYAFDLNHVHAVEEAAAAVSEAGNPAVAQQATPTISPDDTRELITSISQQYDATPARSFKDAAVRLHLPFARPAWLADKRVLAIAAAVLLAAVVLLWLVLRPAPPSDASAPAAAANVATEPTAPAPEQSVASNVAPAQPEALPPSQPVSPNAAKKKAAPQSSSPKLKEDDATIIKLRPADKTPPVPQPAKDEPPAIAFSTPAVPKLPLTPAPPALTLTHVSQRTGGELVHKVTPTYPSLALSQRLAGKVELIATVGVTGRVINVRVVSGPALLTQAAVQAVQQWRYSPLLLDGKPMPQELPITVQFRPRAQ